MTATATLQLTPKAIRRHTQKRTTPLTSREEKRLAILRRHTGKEGKSSKDIPPSPRELEDLATMKRFPGWGY